VETPSLLESVIGFVLAVILVSAALGWEAFKYRQRQRDIDAIVNCLRANQYCEDQER
jgi:hypothetical protein